MAFYVESQDRAYRSYIVSTDMVPGELGAVDSAGTGAEPFDAGSHAEEHFLGVAEAFRSGDQIAEDEDSTEAISFLAANNDRASFGGDADRDVIKVRTAEDTGGNEAAPSISDGTVVGVIDTTAGTLTSTAEYQGRIVEEGYQDGEATPTTYNRTNGNFYAVGVALRDDSTEFDDPVRVEVRKDLN